jgi:hypothetical protein
MVRLVGLTNYKACRPNRLGTVDVRESALGWTGPVALWR